jgi:hypothetical protein
MATQTKRTMTVKQEVDFYIDGMISWPNLSKSAQWDIKLHRSHYAPR